MAVQSYSTGINQQNSVRLFWYSDWLPRYPSPKLKKLKIYETRCINGRHGKKYFKYNNFLTPFCLLLYVEWFGQILWKSVKSTYPINLLKVDTFYKKSIARFSLKKVCKQLMLPQEIMSPLEPQANVVTGPPGVNYNGLEFPGKSVALQSRFWSFDRQDKRKAILVMGNGILCRSFRILRHQFCLILMMSLRGKLHYRKLWFLRDLPLPVKFPSRRHLLMRLWHLHYLLTFIGKQILLNNVRDFWDV